MELTEKLGLKKPDRKDYVKISDINANMDILDDAVGGLKEGSTILEELETNNKTLAGAINETLDKANEAFQSVSDGKQVVATAITDKGIPTSGSDTFQAMSDNIGLIETGIDTSDATATAEDILSGKISYGDERIVGTMPSRGNKVFIPSREIQIAPSGHYGEIIVETIPPDDTSDAPGNKFLIAGDLGAGYFGVVPASELITGDALAGMVGISIGTSQFSDEGWLKFAYNGKIQFVAKKPIRHTLGWNNINAANCVYGGKTVVIGGLTYKVRLMRGALTDPSIYRDSDRGAIGSEWNKLMLPIHIQAKNGNWSHPAYVEPDIPYWGIDFTDEDLLTGSSGSGRYSNCQETIDNSPNNRVYRGDGVSYSDSRTASSGSSVDGWRPVLELVE